ncbi:MAG: NADH-quinone oxidoreductase subunit N [Phycisphaerae bacterium]|nr:NADH-quinone oxidoreductase subunit N [Phycisphaerae bacterium]
MTSESLWALSPLLAVTAAAIAVLLLACFRRNHAAAATICLLGLSAALWLAIRAAACPAAPVRFDDHAPTLLLLDAYAAYMQAVLFAAALAVALFSHDYSSRQPSHAISPHMPRRSEAKTGPAEEFYVLLLWATLGGGVLAAATHVASLFLGLEILSVSLYAMIAYRPHHAKGVAGGVTYLVLASVASAVLLFGMALLYARWGTMDFAHLAAAMRAAESADAPWGGAAAEGLTLAGVALVVVGVGFKLAIAPLHLWAADVYHAAPPPTAAFVATVSKGAVFALFFRFFTTIPHEQLGGVPTLFAVLAGLSMCVGNLLALRENRLTRLLAYSSVAQMGYLLTAFFAGGDGENRQAVSRAFEAAAFYLPVYFAAVLGAFGVVSVLSASRDATRDDGGDSDHLDAVGGLFFRRPVLACVLTLMMMSLAGLPLTGGFVGKFFIVRAGIGTGLWTLSVLLILNSAVSLYYYLRVCAVLFARDMNETLTTKSSANKIHLSATIALFVLSLIVLVLGLYPSPFIEFIRQTVTWGPG